jgi:hypothetical protein
MFRHTPKKYSNCLQFLFVDVQQSQIAGLRYLSRYVYLFPFLPFPYSSLKNTDFNAIADKFEAFLNG